MVVTAIGWRAHAALVASGGKAEVVAALSTSTYATAAGELICKPCRLGYPIRDDIPVMLEEEARKLPPEEEVS